MAWRARQGDADAYGDLVQRYQVSVFNTCYRLLGERREAEDLAQEAFLRAYQRLHTYDPRRPFGPWIRRLATNLCLNHMQVKFPVQVPLEDENSLAGASKDIGLMHEQDESARTVWTALKELPPHYRAVVELRHFQDYSYADIAVILKIPLSDVKSHLFRARKMLGEKLEKHEPYR